MAVEILSEGKFDCHSCDEILKKERGCKEKGSVPFYIENDCYFRCPLTLISNLSYEYIKAYEFYDKAILPNGKGWNNESNKYLQAMIILDNEFSKRRNKVKK